MANPLLYPANRLLAKLHAEHPEKLPFSCRDAAEELDDAVRAVEDAAACATVPTTVLVEERNVYGKHTLYPANKTAQALAEFARRSTFTPRDVEYLKAAGFVVQTMGVNARTL